MSRCGLSDHPAGAEVGAAEDERRHTGSIFLATGMLFFLIVCFLNCENNSLHRLINNGNNQELITRIIINKLVIFMFLKAD